MSEEQIKALNAKRGSAKRVLTCFGNFLDRFNSETDIPELTKRFQELESSRSTFEGIQIELETIQDESAEHEKHRSEYEVKYWSIWNKAHKLLESSIAKPSNFPNISTPVVSMDVNIPPQANSINNESTIAFDSNTIQPKISPMLPANPENQESFFGYNLPRITLPQFDGSIDKWLEFRERFNCVIEKGPRIIPDTIKIIHLKGCLSGEAADVLSSIESTAQNYKIAWELLNERYHHPKLIRASYVQNLLDMPRISKEFTIRVFVDKVQKLLRALQAAGEIVENWDSILIVLLRGKLNDNLRERWDDHSHDIERPTLQQLLSFLNRKAHLEVTKSQMPNLTSHISNDRPKQSNSQSNIRQQKIYMAATSQPRCSHCDENHYINHCPTFLQLNPSQRYEIAKSGGWCTNCLRKGHRSAQCTAGNCRTCKLRHHSLLHFEKNNSSQSTHHNHQSNSGDQPSTSSSVNMQAQISSEAILATAVVDLVNEQGKSRTCRVFLDAGSQAHFITERVASFLNLNKRAVHISVSGLDDISTVVKHSTLATIKSRHNKFQKTIEFLIVPQISATMPMIPVDPKHLEIPQNIPLADPEFFKPSSIDALIGVKLFYKLLSIGQIAIKNQPNAILQKTQLGWIVAGEINHRSASSKIVCHLGIRASVSEFDLTRFWKIEELPSTTKGLSPEEMSCEEHYSAHTTRDISGKYVVRLPFNDNLHKLGESYSNAVKRLYSLENRLKKNPVLRLDYSTFLTEYEELHHMSLSQKPDIKSGFYLPHHAVIKADSTTTKTRVVFDGSSKTSSGLSLNDALMVGPKLQDDLFIILIRYRSHIYAFTADIEKMYRQIRVHPDDVKYQKIIYRKTPQDPINTYNLDTITYGTSSASYLAIRSLQQLADDERDAHPIASAIVKRDFYVDDLLSGSNTLSEARALRDDLDALLKKGGFRLRKWFSNHPSLSDSSPEQTDGISKPLDHEATTKSLGIRWNPFNDTLVYAVNIPKFKSYTKRIILSEIAKLFDPLGLLGPVIVYAKIIVQHCWKSGITWDESVPQDIHNMWYSYQDQLPCLQALKFARCLVIPNAKKFQIHGFCDASEKAYGACLYLRSSDSNDDVYIKLICSKSRVAPVSSITLPRLELCGALLLANLYHIVSKAILSKIDDVFLWCDSTIALHWIHTAPYRLKTFVSNRVAEIQRLTAHCHWRHISSSDNPADFVSRGQLPTEFIENSMWVNGPQWLTLIQEHWPTSTLSNIDLPELKNSPIDPSLCMHMYSRDLCILEKYSSLRTLQHVLAYIIRFLHNARHKQDRRIGALSPQEIRNSHTLIMKLTQFSAFSKEINCLIRKSALPESSKLIQLSPYLDQHNILRVGGRLRLSALHDSQRHPILLPSHHHITRLIIREEHIRLMHAGSQTTLYSIRQRYWPINSRNVVRKVLHQCIPCFRAKPRSADHSSGILPECRVTQSRPFLKTGVDYCGPLFIKEKRFRNRNKIKVYVAIYICMATKAVHLELVNDLTTEAFIASLRRFFARRGKSVELHSDNGTNFVGAYREIQKLFESSNHQIVFNKFLEQEKITWHFIPPRAPHFGGLWEAAVKSFKIHLVRTVGDTVLTYEQLETYVIEIEAILNSRPLSSMSSDPNDLIPLTAGHFLIGGPLTFLPELDITDTPSNRLSAWQHAQQLKQHFWKRWHKEYLHGLIQLQHHSSAGNLQVGRLVIIREDKIPPLSWPMGRIIAVHPGLDGIVRVATVKTRDGEYKRCVKKLCPLSEE